MPQQCSLVRFDLVWSLIIVAVAVAVAVAVVVMAAVSPKKEL